MGIRLEGYTKEERGLESIDEDSTKIYHSHPPARSDLPYIDGIYIAAATIVTMVPGRWRHLKLNSNCRKIFRIIRTIRSTSCHQFLQPSVAGHVHLCHPLKVYILIAADDEQL